MTAGTGPTPMTGEQAAAYQRLRAHLAYLKLPTAAEQLPEILDAARAEKLSITATLERLLAAEVSDTEARRLGGRLRFASLPAPWTLEDLDFDASPALDRQLIDDLATLRFIEQARNVLLVGPPGGGKTHIAIGLARKAAEARHGGYRPLRKHVRYGGEDIGTPGLVGRRRNADDAHRQPHIKLPQVLGKHNGQHEKRDEQHGTLAGRKGRHTAPNEP